jgi:hypothetical protein
MLIGMSNNTDHTIPQLTKMLDELIDSNGEHCGFLSPSFVTNLFPCLAFLEFHRFHNRFNLHRKRDSNVQAKQEQAHNDKVTKQREYVLSLNSKELSSWVADNDHWLTEQEMRDILKHWYMTIENGDSYDFHIFYADMSAQQIAFDLSLPM